MFNPKLFDLPAIDIAEITVIGTGGGYGESIVIHLGNSEWIVIDSCIDPFTRVSLPLQYLLEIGVDVKTQVKLILCTHWHDDHIQGMANLLDACKASKFSFARCNDMTKFMLFLNYDIQKVNGQANTSSTIEFYNCIKIVHERSLQPISAIQDRTIYTSPLKGFKAEMYSLSPSDFTLTKFDLELSKLIDIAGQRNKKVVNISPNFRSVVTYLKINDHRVLLGADLEFSPNKNEGWANILEACLVLDKEFKATLFKVPHHGSENGYSKEQWETLLVNNPVANLTPWNRNQKLPQIEMLKILADHTNQIYLTANVNTLGNKAKKRERGLEKVIQEKNSSLREVKYKHGVIRCRVNIVGTEPWEVRTFGDAIHVNTVLLSQD